MELSQLRIFKAAAETLNFTRAAKQLGMTQAAVSHQIKSLETELGESLFIRSPRTVRLSEAGKLTLEAATRMLDDAEMLRAEIAGREGEVRGKVRVAAATQAFVSLFAPFFEEFMLAHPSIEFSFHTTVSTDQTVLDILNGTADVGFASLPVYSPLLSVTEIFTDELLLIVAANHPLAQYDEVDAAAITQERLILFERGASIRRASDDFFKRVGYTPKSVVESNDTYFVKWMIERGLGVALLPAWSVSQEVASGKLCRLRLMGQRLPRSVAMVALARFQPSSTRAFLDFILTQQSDLQYLAVK